MFAGQARVLLQDAVRKGPARCLGAATGLAGGGNSRFCGPRGKLCNAYNARFGLLPWNPMSVALVSLAGRLRQLLGSENVLDAHSELVVYECDGFTVAKNAPDIAVFPPLLRMWPRLSRVVGSTMFPFCQEGLEPAWLAGVCR